MSQHELRYDRMVESALRDVVRQALALVAEHGLPGNHHFFITFRTDHPDVEMTATLVERYPKEMTIVLQHQFWALRVAEELFEVTLSFNDKPERLIVPYAAISSFADPSVRFGLQFDVADGDAEDDDSQGDLVSAIDASNNGLPAAAPTGSKDLAARRDSPEAQRHGEDAASGDGEADAGSGDEKVVTLDTFRKK